jgi:hypothetical protein
LRCRNRALNPQRLWKWSIHKWNLWAPSNKSG